MRNIVNLLLSLLLKILLSGRVMLIISGDELLFKMPANHLQVKKRLSLNFRRILLVVLIVLESHKLSLFGISHGRFDHSQLLQFLGHFLFLLI